MSIKRKACIVGAFEHPTRNAPDTSLQQLHAECARGALEDAGLSLSDIDAYYCAGDSPGFGGLSMAEYLGLRLNQIDSTETGGSAPLVHVNHAAQAIATGKARIALVTLAGRPRQSDLGKRAVPLDAADVQFEGPYAAGPPVNHYALAARRHMHEFGTTSEQLAWIKVAASHHAAHNPHAYLKEKTTVEEVLASPMVADPLRRADCCVVTDGGGALIIAHPDVAKSLRRPRVNVLGAAEAVKHVNAGKTDLTFTGAVWSGPRAFAEAGVAPADIQYASIYDSFTITVLITLEDLGFCAKGEGGRFVMDGNLISGVGRLPFNTDGGGLCNNHPANRGGMTKVIEAVRQLRGEANAPVQVPGCTLALAHGTGGSLGFRHGSATLILERA
jgi:acetyl-CoA C-acetyltransferase